jgi:VIT1/CCC1 family predicted Fe2+/Mn2+ transporter
MAYLVAIENNRVSEVRQIPDADYDELGVEWALSELRDTYRHSKSVSASFSLGNDSELEDFLGAVKAMLGAEALGEAGQDFSR